MKTMSFVRCSSILGFLLAVAPFAFAAQTELVVGIAGDDYGYDQDEGIYLVDPDQGTWTYVAYEDQIWDVAGDARGNLCRAFDGRGYTYITNGGWSFSPQYGTINLGDGPDGYLYFRVGSEVRRVRAGGYLEEVLGTVSGPQPTDFATGPDGTLYCLAGGDLYALDLDTLQMTLVASLTIDLYSLGISDDGRFWGIPFWSSSLYEIDPTTGQVTFVMYLPPAPQIYFPTYSLGSQPGPFTPTDVLQLTAPATAQAGQAVTFDVSQGLPYAGVLLFASGQGTGYAYAAGVQPLGLARPITVVAHGVTDVFGNLSMVRVVPSYAAGRSFWFEAVMLQSLPNFPHYWDSNTVQVDVQ